MKKKRGSKVHKDIRGFDIQINQFGELKSNLNIEDLNRFLDRHVSDKKIRDQAPGPEGPGRRDEEE